MEILHSPNLTPYAPAVEFMETRVAQIVAGEAEECLWFLQHPPLYTAGTSAKPHELLDANAFPVHQTGRGGAYTYHGPGQRVVYIMCDLRTRGQDVRAFVRTLEQWVIAALGELQVDAYTIDGRVGIWVRHNNTEAKIGAIGLRVRKWVSFHGIAINVNPDLSHFNGIVPCGIEDKQATSLAALAPNTTMQMLDDALLHNAPALFEFNHNIVNREFVVNAA